MAWDDKNDWDEDNNEPEAVPCEVAVEAPPLVAVVSSSYTPTLSQDEIVELKKQWNDLWGGSPPCPLFVLPPGCSFGLMR